MSECPNLSVKLTGFLPHATDTQLATILVLLAQELACRRLTTQADFAALIRELDHRAATR